MKFLFLAEYYPPYIMGGAEVSLSKTIDILKGLGHEIYILTPECKSSKERITRKGNVTVHRYKSIKRFTYKKASQTFYKKTPAIFQIILSQLQKIFASEMRNKALKLIRKKKFDIIHSNNIESCMALSGLKTDAVKISHVRDLAMVSLNYRTYKDKYTKKTGIKELNSYLETNSFLSWIILNDVVKRRKKALENIDVFIAINQFVKKNLVIEGIDPEKIHVIYNPEEINDQKQERKKLGIDRWSVLYVGSLVRFKGVEMIPKLAKEMPEADFIVIGDGPLKNIFNKTTKNLHHIGQKENRTVKKYYRSCDCLILPQKVHYGVGRVMIEAMLSKIPVISSKIAGIDEFIRHKRTGMIAKDKDEFKDCIKTLMIDEKLRKEISDNALNIVGKRFSKGYIRNELKALIDRLQ